MDVSELVRAVVSSVMEQLSATAPQECVLVLGHRDERAAAAVEQALGLGCTVRYLGEEGQEHVVRRILPRLSCNDMADLSVGRASGPLMSEVQRLLLAGQKVEVLEYEYRQYADTASGALYRLYGQHADTLAEFGLVPFVKPRPEYVRVWESVISAEHVRQAAQAGAPELQVLKTAVVTPLAAEQAKLDSISISKTL